MSILIQRLDSELLDAVDPQRKAELLARRACALARQGRNREALEGIQLLRRHYGDWSSGITHAWIMLAEGVVHWVADLSVHALDRVLRAQLLGTAMRDPNLIAITSAWRAHIEFERSDFDAMFRSLQVALVNASDLNRDAHSRIAIVIFNVLALCGELDRARFWYGRGHELSVQEGDQAGIDALQYNRAVLGVAWARIARFDGELSPEFLRSVRLEFETSRNYQALTRINTLERYFKLCDARLLALEGDYISALKMLRSLGGASGFAANHCSDCLIELEAAHCLYRGGDIAGSLEAFARVDFAMLLDLDIDDRFVAICIAAELSAADQRFGEASAIEQQRQLLREAYSSTRARLVAGIDSLDVPFASTRIPSTS